MGQNSKPKPVYTARCSKAWDGDSFGNEWTCGAAVFKEPDGIFHVYEDDGEGNGNGLATFPLLFDAKAYADLWCKHMDEGGYGGSPTHIEMCRLAEARSVCPRTGMKPTTTTRDGGT